MIPESRAAFAAFDLLSLRAASPLLWAERDVFSTRLFSVPCAAGAPLEVAEGRTLFGFIGAGRATLTTPQAGSLTIGPGMYFSLPGPGRVEAARDAVRDAVWGVAVERPNYTGFFQVGGPIEQMGRLRYIDGCTDSLLLSPVRWGDPCLNLLYLPPQTRQSAHTHPSVRAGVIVSGRGRCVIDSGAVSLAAGLAFVIPADTRHCFHTDEEPLRVIAYHPDSDFGPRDEDHPMINRTILGDAPSAGQPQRR